MKLIENSSNFCKLDCSPFDLGLDIVTLSVKEYQDTIIYTYTKQENLGK